MNYIVLDLEWNQPFGKRTTGKPPIQCEIIQIGATKVSSEFEIIETFNIFVRPQFNKQLHPAVRKLMQTQSSALSFGHPFPAAIRHFLNWCGDDCIFVTWGTNDIPVLQENFKFYKINDKRIDGWFDIQPIFNRQTNQPKGQKSLQYAAEHFQIEIDKKLHDAENDSYYTAEIFKRIDIFEGVKVPEKQMAEHFRKIREREAEARRLHAIAVAEARKAAYLAKLERRKAEAAKAAAEAERTAAATEQAKSENTQKAQ